MRRHHRAGEAQQPVLRRHRLWKQVEPARHRRELPLLDEERVVVRDQLDGGVHVAGRGRVVGRVDDQTSVPIPGARAAVETGESVRRGRLELVLEELTEEVVIAVPLAPGVERDEQQVRVLQVSQQRARLLPLGDGVAQGAAETFQDAGLQQERPELGWLAGENLGGQIVNEVAVVAGEALDQRARIGSAAERERGQVDCSRPALRPRLQARHILSRKFKTQSVGEERSGLLIGEAKLGGTHLA
jgi:hypothetical protein